MKITAETKSYLNLDEKTLRFITEEKSDMENMTKQMYEQLIDFKEKAIKEALIELGWTPPKEKK